jgi:hypothetical protein
MHTNLPESSRAWARRAGTIGWVGISPYLRRLREAIGHELALVPSVVVLVWVTRRSRAYFSPPAEVGYPELRVYRIFGP